MTELFPGRERLSAEACLIGERIDVRALDRAQLVSPAPWTLRVGASGLATVYRYGAVVMFELSPQERADFLALLAPHVTGAFHESESDDAEIRIRQGAPEGVDDQGRVCIREPGLSRLQLVAHILARSAVLAHYETSLTEVLAAAEPLADELRQRGRSRLRSRDVLRQIGEALATEMRMVGRAEISEKPEMTWDEPELDRLYERLAEEYELRERDAALTRKLELLSRAAGMFHDLLQTRRSLRVEWYIVALIAVEIAILMYELWLR